MHGGDGDGCEKNFPPGLKWQLAFDNVAVVRESIIEVLKTLGEAIGLVVLVMFLFLQNWRSTIIPAITIPVSLIGTFAFVKLFGFSINTLTLFGIVLATGIVVDDAIVVIENIERHMREFRQERARRGGRRDARSVLRGRRHRHRAGRGVRAGRVLSGHDGPDVSAVLADDAFAVVLSVFNAVTFTPALSALLLDNRAHARPVLRVREPRHRRRHERVRAGRARGAEPDGRCHAVAVRRRRWPARG